jgi:tRNA (guanine10-N2)-methyltransferase
MDFFIRLAQVHESFRKPELEALAQLLNIQLEFIEYNAEVRYLSGLKGS